MSWEYSALEGLKSGSSAEQSQEIRWQEQQVTTKIILRKLKTELAVILGDEVGMGKTWIGLLTALSVARHKRVLVLTPNRVLALQWCEQMRDLIKNKFPEDQQDQYRDLLVGEEPFYHFNDLLDWANEHTHGIFITSYSAIDPTDPQNLYSRRMKEDGYFELLIIDEGHKFKNSFTEKYQLFEVTSDKKNYRAPLRSKFKRLLLMTATPFQLGHQDLRVILGIANSSSDSSELKLEFNAKIDRLIDALDGYQVMLKNFEKLFSKLKTQEEVALLEQLIKKADKDTIPFTNAIEDAAAQFALLVSAKEALNRAMTQFVVRNTKSKHLRKNKPRPIELLDEAKLTFFIGDSLQKIKMREKQTKDQGAIMTSSFSRFEEMYESEGQSAVQKHYVDLTKSIKDHSFAALEHPKVDLIINHAFENWLHGNKTLIFAFYKKTIDELNRKLQRKISDHVNNIKLQFPQEGAERFLERIGQSEFMESLVLRDNPIHVSLLPLLKENYTSAGIENFFKLSPADKEEVIAYLGKIKYPKLQHNYFKLLTALCYIYFSKFKRMHPEAISDSLHDDFEEICDSNATVFKTLFKVTQEEGVEEQSFKKNQVPENLRNIFDDHDKIKAIALFPTIWEKHRVQLEALHISKRLHLTEVVWSYLTTDEFIFMDLLEGQNEIPSFEKFPDLYAKEALANRESTYKKIERLLDQAEKMDDQNLENLVNDIAYRYRPNKRNVGKIIVETVSGENSADEKHRSVIAFKTPLAPNILISSSVLAEGVDLHKECNDIVHYDHEWNPANLEQKIGRLDRVGSKGEKIKKIDIHYPYIAGTQDEKAFNIVMARRSWFGAVMGEKYEDKWKESDPDQKALSLPESMQELLVMNLGNDAHR